jgi:hypothetical protein
MNRRVIASGVMAAGLLTGCAAPQTPETPSVETSATQPASGFYFQPGEAENLQASFDRLKASYVNRGFGNVAAAKLVLIEGGNTYDCDRTDDIDVETTSMTPSGNFYCGPYNEVVLTAGFTIMNRILGRNDTAMNIFSHGHELGHSAQNGNKVLNDRRDPAEEAAFEIQATCLAGQAIKDVYPGQVGPIVDMLSQMPVADTHGSTEAQTNAFVHGAQGGDC